ncbi:MAG TPA: hypothetical protein VD997_01615 [Phycisphaerales bacterium]|nr:hypothetical protein [Phycisphaerales bacterium]
MDRFDYYELAVTSAEPLARFLMALHGRGARVLGEDFSGTAALSRGWLGLDRRHRAVAVDLDGPTLVRIPRSLRLAKVQGDVLKVRDKADIIGATNFPVCYWHTRGELVKYLRHVRSRLNRGGVFVADLYGGPTALVPGRRSKRIPLGPGRVLHYTWHQRSVDPLTMRVLNSIHFRVSVDGKTVETIRDAFTYDWRLWSIPELRDAMSEAGFRSTEVHDRMGAAIDHEGRVHVRAVEEHEIDADFVVYVVGRRD